MRPTDFGMKSPADKTPFPRNPLLTKNGDTSELRNSRRGFSFSSRRRFDQYDLEARKSCFRVGPGTYRTDNESLSSFKAKKVLKYRPLETRIQGDKNGFYYAGHMLVYEQKFAKP